MVKLVDVRRLVKTYVPWENSGLLPPQVDISGTAEL